MIWKKFGRSFTFHLFLLRKRLLIFTLTPIIIVFIEYRWQILIREFLFMSLRIFTLSKSYYWKSSMLIINIILLKTWWIFWNIHLNFVHQWLSLLIVNYYLRFLFRIMFIYFFDCVCFFRSLFQLWI